MESISDLGEDSGVGDGVEEVLVGDGVGVSELEAVIEDTIGLQPGKIVMIIIHTDKKALFI
jgi:hypothetical protein